MRATPCQVVVLRGGREAEGVRGGVLGEGLMRELRVEVLSA
eukprot:CAMPEP_0184389970 /NCGR_PEP_ID=MMETSP0007-20130409/12947_1 /TAXON_ID=97485 /ORGANISM="Prymnesium parvum, Strain Texoma1" /LENGTH=40 /DNA_ID= /DNA_START= /DNA_END= /DNA_ORIENTATION=